MKPILALLLISAASAQTIKTVHPRVFLDAARLAELRAKRTGTAAQKAQWNTLISYNSQYCATGTYLTCATTLALAYAVDPTLTKYGDRACEIIAFHTDPNDGNPAGYLDADSDLASGNSLRWYGYPIALAYDWAYDRCSEAQKTTIRGQFTRLWEMVRIDGTWPNGKFSMHNSPYHVTGNLALGQLRTMALGALAMNEPGFDTTTWLAGTMAQWRGKVQPCWRNSTAIEPLEVCYGGGWREGTEYVPEGKFIAWDFAEAVTTATDTDLWSETPLALNQWQDYLFAYTSPTGPVGAASTLYQPWLMRDVQHYGIFWVTDRDLGIRMAAGFRKKGDTQRARWQQDWLNVVQPYANPNASGVSMDAAVAEFLYHDPSALATDHKAASPDVVTPFMFLARSNSGPDATWTGMIAIPEGGDHTFGDSGTFQIYRKGVWLSRALPGYGIGAQTYVRTTPSHNGLTLNGHGSNSSASRGGGSDVGWSRLTRTATGYKGVCGSAYCYAQADIKDEHRFFGYLITPDVETVTRDYLYLKPDLIVSASRIKYVAGLNAGTISHIQSGDNLATIVGNRATISNGNQRLYVNVVSPAAATLKAIAQNKCYVMKANKISADVVDVYVDCYHSKAAGNSVVIFGITGEWAVLNGTWPVITASRSQTVPYSDGVSYNGERFRVSGVGAFASITGAWPLAQSGVAGTDLPKVVTINTVPIPHFRVDVSGGTYANTESHLMVMEAADNTATPLVTSDYSTTNWQIAGFGAYVAGTPKLEAVVLPVTYSFDPAAAATISHYLMGLAPDTTYSVQLTVPGQATIDVAGGAGDQIQSTPEGLLIFSGASAPASNIGINIQGAYRDGFVARYGMRGLSANQTCQREIFTDATLANVVEVSSDAGGHAIRQKPLGEQGSLSAGATYYLRVTCGNESGVARFSTTPVVSPVAKTIPVAVGPIRTATEVVVQYGTSAMSSNMTVPCVSGCRWELPATAGKLVFWKTVFRDGMGRPVATGQRRVNSIH